MVRMTPWLARGKLVSDIHNVRGRITNRKSNIERDIEKSGVRRNGVPLREKKALRGTECMIVVGEGTFVKHCQRKAGTSNSGLATTNTHRRNDKEQGVAARDSHQRRCHAGTCDDQ